MPAVQIVRRCNDEASTLGKVNLRLKLATYFGDRIDG